MPFRHGFILLRNQNAETFYFRSTESRRTAFVHPAIQVAYPVELSFALVRFLAWGNSFPERVRMRSRVKFQAGSPGLSPSRT